MKIQKLKLPALVATLALTAHAAIAANNTTLANGNSVYGVPMVATTATRVVDVTKSSKTVNVDCGDVVSFSDGDKTFTWKFDVVGHQKVELASIAPAGFAANSLKVYVSLNQSEHN